MIKRFYAILITLFCIMLFALPVWAAYTDCKYYCRVDVVNTSGTTYTNQRVQWQIDADTIVTNGYMQADGDDAYLLSGGTVRALTNKNLTNTAAIWGARVPSVPPGTTSTYLYIGSATDTRDAIWVADDGDSAYAADDATLDIQDLLTLSSNVYLYAVPGGEQEIISKEGAYELYADATNWGIRIYQDGVPVVGGEFNPTGDDTVGLTPSVGADNYACIDELSPLAAGADGDYVEYPNTLGAGSRYDYYEITGLPVGSTITAVTASFRGAAQSSPNHGFITPFVYSPITGIVEGVEQPLSAWADYAAVAIAYTGSSDGLLVGIKARSTGSSYVRCSQLYFNISYTPPDAGHTSETPITVTNAWVNIKGTWDSGANELIISEGATTNTEAPGAGNIHQNTEPVHVAEFDGDVDDVRIGDTALLAPTWHMDLDFEPNQISATVITDQSASTNDVTYAWSALPAGLTNATVGNLIPTSATSTSSATAPESPDMVGELSEDPNMYTTDASMNLPGTEIDSVVAQLATTIGVTNAYWVWWLIYAVFAVAIFIWVWLFSHHLFIAGFALAGFTWVCSNIQIVPFWLVIAMTIIAVGLFASERSPNL